MDRDFKLKKPDIRMGPTGDCPGTTFLSGFSFFETNPQTPLKLTLFAEDPGVLSNRPSGEASGPGNVPGTFGKSVDPH